MGEAKAPGRRLSLVSGGDVAVTVEATKWAMRLVDQTAALSTQEWLDLTAWLEARPQHLEALEDAERALEALARHNVELKSANHRRQAAPLRGWFVYAGAGSIAAALILLVVAHGWGGRLQQQKFDYRSNSQARRIVLADGSLVRLNRGTALHVLLTGHRRTATLSDGGQALFDIAHDARRPFHLEVDGAVVSVLGTRFDVDDTAGALRVAVSRGRVAVTPAEGRSRMDVPAGRFVLRDSQRLILGSVPPQAVGAWAEGRLIYADAPFSRVVADLARYWNGPIKCTPQSATLRFSGVLRISDPATMTRDLEALAPVVLQRGPRYTLIVKRSSS